MASKIDERQACGAVHTETEAVCELPSGHKQNHRGSFAHGISQWPEQPESNPARVGSTEEGTALGSASPEPSSLSLPGGPQAQGILDQRFFVAGLAVSAPPVPSREDEKD